MKAVPHAKAFSPHSRLTRPPKQPDQERASAAGPPSRGGSEGKRILLVDDDPVVRDSVGNVLLGEGFQVIPAADGQRAVDLANRMEIDLVLLDLNMPLKNGWDTFEQLTREHPILPIIIITARPNQVFTALSAGAGALLEKPMDIPTLLQTMRKLLAETAEQRLARLVGKSAEFHYRPAGPGRKCKPTKSPPPRSP
jgi:DNA-binding response OmpR family regulator